MSDEGMLAELEEHEGAGVVRVSDVYATDAADLWSAITDRARVERWIAEMDGEPGLGVPVRARFTSGWSGTLTVRECRPTHHLVVDSTDDDGTGTVIEAWLTPADGGTHLLIEERGLPLATYSDHGPGWQVHLEDLRAHLDGRSVSDWHSRWTELRRSSTR